MAELRTWITGVLLYGKMRLDRDTATVAADQAS